MNRQEACWSGVLGRGLYPPQLLGRVHLRKMNGDLSIGKSFSRFTFHVEHGNLITSSTGKPAVEITPREAVTGVFRWGQGTFSFVNSTVEKEGPAVESRHTSKLILDGVRAIKNHFLVEEALGRAEGLVRPSNRPPDVTALQLTPVESFLLSRIDRSCTIEELCLVSPVTRQETLTGMYVLLCAGVLAGGDDPILQEPALKTGFSGRDLPGAVRSFSGLGATRPPAVVQPSYSRSRRQPVTPPVTVRPSYSHTRQQPAGDPAVVGLPSNNNWREDAAAVYGEAIVKSKVRETPEESEPSAHPDMAQYHFEKGLEHYSREDFFGAVQLFELAVKIDDRKAEYHRHLALALSRNPRWGKKAEQALLQAVRLEPEHAETHYFLGRIYLDSGLPARAMSRFRESLRIDPNLRPARLELAVMNGAAREAERDPVSPALLCSK